MRTPTREEMEARLLRRRSIEPRGYSTDCWIWTGSCNKAGYGSVAWIRGQPQKRVHRIAAWLWLGFDLDSELCSLHHCDVPPCFNPEHLFIGTKKDNTLDMVAKGRQNLDSIRGEGNHNAKLTAEKVREIRRRCADGETRAELAREFGVSYPVVFYIVAGRIWRHVE